MAIGEPLAVLGPALTRDLGFQTTLIEKHPTLYGLAAVPLATGWPPTSIRDHSAMSLRCRVSACATTVGLPRQPVSPWSPGSVASWCHCSRAPPPRRWRMYREAAWGGFPARVGAFLPLLGLALAAAFAACRALRREIAPSGCSEALYAQPVCSGTTDSPAATQKNCLQVWQRPTLLIMPAS